MSEVAIAPLWAVQSKAARERTKLAPQEQTEKPVMSSGDVITTERSATLVSGGTGAWTDGTTIQLDWTFHFLGSRAGFYRAAPVKVVVRPPDTTAITGATLHIVERFPYSGMIAKQADFALSRTELEFRSRARMGIHCEQSGPRDLGSVRDHHARCGQDPVGGSHLSQTRFSNLLFVLRPSWQ